MHYSEGTPLDHCISSNGITVDLEQSQHSSDVDMAARCLSTGMDSNRNATFQAMTACGSAPCWPALPLKVIPLILACDLQCELWNSIRTLVSVIAGSDSWDCSYEDVPYRTQLLGALLLTCSNIMFLPGVLLAV